MSDALYQDEDSILKHPTPSLRDKLKLKPKTLEDSFVSTDESIGPLRPDEDRTGLYESEADEGPSGINQVHSDNEEDSFLNDEGEVSLQEGDTLTMEQSGRNAFRHLAGPDSTFGNQARNHDYDDADARVEPSPPTQVPSHEKLLDIAGKFFAKQSNRPGKAVPLTSTIRQGQRSSSKLESLPKTSVGRHVPTLEPRVPTMAEIIEMEEQTKTKDETITKLSHNVATLERQVTLLYEEIRKLKGSIDRNAAGAPSTSITEGLSSPPHLVTKVAVSALEPAGSSRPPASTRSQPATQAVGSPKPLPEVTTLAPTRTDSKEKNTLCYCGTCLHSVNTLTQEKKEQHPCRRLNKDSEFLNLTMAEAKAMRVMRREREIAEQDVRGVKRKHDDDDEGIEDQPSAPTKRKTRQGSHQVTNEAKASTKVNTNDEAPHRKSSRKAGTTLLKAGSRSITKGKTRVKADEQKAKTESKVRTNGKRKRETGAEVDEVESEHKKGRVKRV